MKRSTSSSSSKSRGSGAIFFQHELVTQHIHATLLVGSPVIGKVNDSPAVRHSVHNALISNFLGQRIDLTQSGGLEILQSTGHQTGAHGGLQGVKVKETLATAARQ